MRSQNDLIRAVNKLLPPHVYPDVIRRYADLESLVAKLLAPAGYNATILIGNPGNGKSTPFERALRDANAKGGSAPLAISTTHNTAHGLYTWAYDNLDRLLVLDDDRALLKDKKVVNVLMGLGDTRPGGKRMTWNSSNGAMRKAGIPTFFSTQSRLVIINNSIQAAATVLDALADRANIVLFDPPPAELHAHAPWADPEIYGFVGKNLQMMPYASFRWYFRAAEKKAHGEDWRAWLVGTWMRDPSLKLFVMVQNDSAFRTVAERVEQFIQLGKLEYIPASRATYFRIAKAYPRLVGERAAPTGSAPATAVCSECVTEK